MAEAAMAEAAAAREESARLRDELLRLQAMVMQYAQLLLEHRLKLATTTSAERQQIPQNLAALRKAAGAIGATRPAPPRVADAERYANGNGEAKHAHIGGAVGQPNPALAASAMVVTPSTPTVQAELARLRLQVAQLSDQNKVQLDEIVSARRIAAQLLGQDREPSASLLHLLQVVRDMQRDERRRREAEVSLAHVGEVEYLRDQVATLQESLRAAQQETTQHRTSSTSVTGELHSLRARVSELQAEVSRQKLELQAAHTASAKLQQSLAEAAQELRVQQQQAVAALLRAQNAEKDLSTAQSETSEVLPQWHDQLERAEAQLRALSAEVREKDGKARTLEATLQARDEEVGALQVKLAEVRRAFEAAENALKQLHTEHAALQEAHHKLQEEQSETDAGWKLLALEGKHSRLQRMYEELEAEKNELQAAYDEAQAQRKAMRKAQQSALNAHAEEKDGLQRALNESKRALTAAEAARELAMREVASLRASRAGGDSDAAGSASRVQQLQRELSEREAELQELRDDLRRVGAVDHEKVAQLKEREKDREAELAHLRAQMTEQTSLLSQQQQQLTRVETLERELLSARQEVAHSRRRAELAERRSQELSSAAERPSAGTTKQPDSPKLPAVQAGHIEPPSKPASEPPPKPAAERPPPKAVEPPPPKPAEPPPPKPAVVTPPKPAELPPPKPAEPPPPKPAEPPPPPTPAEPLPPNPAAPPPPKPAEAASQASKTTGLALEVSLPPSETKTKLIDAMPRSPEKYSGRMASKPVNHMPSSADMVTRHSDYENKVDEAAKSPDSPKPVEAEPMVRPMKIPMSKDPHPRPTVGSFRWAGEAGTVQCFYASGTHIGGSGANPEKQNQDAMFCVHCDRSTLVWGVLDGHGYDNGQLASQTAARALADYFEKHYAELTRDPQRTMGHAFEMAHKKIWQAMVDKYMALGTPLIETKEGFMVEQDGQPVDGGTTATVVALVQGHLLVVANVGDSDALLGGTLADGSIGYEQLCADHTPANVDEYIRIAQVAMERPEGWQPAVCAYDTDAGALLEIFRISEEGEVDLDKDTVERLDELNVGFKTARGDRPTALFVLENDQYGQQKLAVTRALGDFYMQYHGVTWEPAVSCIDLFDVTGQLEQITLVLGSDGLWDLWGYKDLLEVPLRLSCSQQNVLASLENMIKDTCDHSNELFGEDADNITAVLVQFNSVDPA